MRKSRNIIWPVVSLILLTSALVTCSKRKESPLGMDQYPDSLLLTLDTLTLTSPSDSTYHQFVSTARSRTLLLGFGEECEARILFRFDKEIVDYGGATMRLPLTQSLEEQTEFTIHRVSGAWEDTVVEWPFRDYDPTPLMQVSVAAGETLIVLDPPAPETLFSDEDTTLSWNIILIPSTGGLAKFNSNEAEERPVIELYMPADTVDVHPDADAYIITLDTTLDPSLLWVGSGWVLRSDLTFDVSAIPSGAIINQAELILQSPDTPGKSFEISAFIPDVSRSAAGYIHADSTTLHMLVTDLLQYWVSTENAGLTLKATYEIDNVFRVPFFASGSPEGPIIRVMYTEKVYED